MQSKGKPKIFNNFPGISVIDPKTKPVKRVMIHDRVKNVIETL